MAVAFTRSYENEEAYEATLFYGNERDADSISIKDDNKSTQEVTRGLFDWEKRSPLRRRILQVVIGTVGLAIIVVIICAFTLQDTDRGYTCIGKARFKLDDKKIEFKNTADKFVLSGEIGLLVHSTLNARHTGTSSSFRYITEDGISLVLTQESDFSLIVNWTSSSKSIGFLDCLSMKNSHWYGGSELVEQQWPLEKVSVNMGRYLPQDARHSQNSSAGATYSSVLERYWLSSNGVAVIVDASVPLHVSINASGNQKLCLKSDTDGYLSPAVSKLTYRILSGNNAKSLHLKVINGFLGKPKDIPAAEIIKYPIWITTGSSENISQKEVIMLGQNIAIHRFFCSHIIIKGQFSKEYENYNFDPVRFPSPKTMVQKLQKYGCNVSLNVQPHVKIGSQAFNQWSQQGYFLKDCGGKVPGLIKWQDYLSACIDFTFQKDKDWFKKQLKTFQQEFGFASFAFESGVVTHLPFCYQFHNQSMDPGFFTQQYAQFAAEFKGVDICVGYKTQDLPIFVKMMNKDSTWDTTTGLRSLIPTVLTFGIMGYPFVLPSVVGGHHDNVEKELYIRWMQATVFLPGIQLLKTPWEYDNETIQIVQDLLKLRSNQSQVILEAFYNATKTGAPVVRPLWWVAPSDNEALIIDSQFMLGNNYLVAPVLKKGETKKVVYLPAGRWQEQFKEHKIIDITKGGRWVKYNVTLKDLLYFKCLSLYN